MIDIKILKSIAQARLQDAESLAMANRHDGAIYLCGYAVEIGLKARVCKTLKWSGFPSTKKEFEGYSSFKTHNFDTLLHLSGIESKIKSELLAEWSIVAEWDPESRYNPIGKKTAADSQSMIDSTKALLRKL